MEFDFMSLFGSPMGADPYALGNLFRTNPDAAAPALADMGPPPAPGQDFSSWLTEKTGGIVSGLGGLLPSAPQGPNPLQSGFIGTPAVDPTTMPTVPYGQSNLGQMFNPAPPTPTAPAPGVPGVPLPTGDPRRTMGPSFTQEGMSMSPSPLDVSQPISRNPMAGVTTGPTLEQAGKAPASPGINQAQADRLGKSAQSALSGLKAPAGPELPKAPATPGLPHPGAMPKDAILALLAQLSGQTPQMRLQQALAGLR